ncbi:MAG: FliH/SctL family protein [Planctomycetota bacterium]|nr:FliH/SctL family protein [Planctomycetota bacterium]
MSLLRSPARIIKGQSPLGSDTAALQYTDLKRQCTDLLASARVEAEELLEAARAESRRQATDEGYAAGCAAAHDTMEKEIERRAALRSVDAAREQVGPLLHAVDDLLTQLTAEREQWVARSETQVMQLAAAMAGRIVRAELTAQPHLADGMLRDALSLAAGIPQVALRVNPCDVSLVQGPGSRQGLNPGCRIVSDPSITPGGCFVELTSGSIDARVETQLARMVAELTGE